MKKIILIVFLVSLFPAVSYAGSISFTNGVNMFGGGGPCTNIDPNCTSYLFTPSVNFTALAVKIYDPNVTSTQFGLRSDFLFDNPTIIGNIWGLTGITAGTILPWSNNVVFPAVPSSTYNSVTPTSFSFVSGTSYWMDIAPDSRLLLRAFLLLTLGF